MEVQQYYYQFYNVQLGEDFAGVVFCAPSQSNDDTQSVTNDTLSHIITQRGYKLEAHHKNIRNKGSSKKPSGLYVTVPVNITSYFHLPS